ncbi:hypothetical protein [Nitratireductor aquibiodomus]|uniref:hypothetical protein n=1 Tax=Nitratireductor aquibiodomus TaxID=204799 RepID=UPI0012FE2271|nr:hypothetical protein [Nitratireductor aquibiodomus]
MANLPTLEEIERAILEKAQKWVKRPQEIFPVYQLNVELQQEGGFTAKEIGNALKSMHENGWISESQSPVHLLITESGFSEM